MQNIKSPRTKRTQSYVNEAFRQIQQMPDIMDIVIVNRIGNPVKTTMDPDVAIQFVGMYDGLIEKVKMGLQKLNKHDELLMLRVRTKNSETIITPDDDITVMVVQNAQDKIQM